MISMVFGPPETVSRLDTTGQAGVQLNTFSVEVVFGVAMGYPFFYPWLDFALVTRTSKGCGDEDFVAAGIQSALHGVR
jgi:hypothetical protein